MPSMAAPFRTGFCEVGHHARCPVEVRWSDRAAVCTCGCHQPTPELPPAPHDTYWGI